MQSYWVLNPQDDNKYNLEGVLFLSSGTLSIPEENAFLLCWYSNSTISPSSMSEASIILFWALDWKKELFNNQGFLADRPGPDFFKKRSSASSSNISFALAVSFSVAVWVWWLLFLSFKCEWVWLKSIAG